MNRSLTTLSALTLLVACTPGAGQLTGAQSNDSESRDAPATFIVVSKTTPEAPTAAQPTPPQATASVQPLADPPMQTGGPNPAAAEPDPPFVATEFGRFNEPWAMTFLPDGRLLVTEKNRRLRLFNTATKQTSEISGVPAVAYGGQGGLGDVVLHPQFSSNRYVYLSYAEAGANSTRGAAVARAQLTLNADGNGGSLSGLQVVWRQTPKVTGEGHYSHRIAFGGDGKLWITSGDRQKFDPAQDMQQNLGKLIRLNDDGTIPADNPFVGVGGVAAQVWTLGHRNLLGIAFDPAGRLWTHEMGPAGGDELNLIERGTNYGWPIVSNGDHYDGTPIPDHPTRPEFNAPEAWWNPVIAPAGFIIYTGDLFPYFRGQGFIGGLASQALVRIQFDGTSAREYKRYPMGARIREVEQGPDGAIWVLEDSGNARLLKLTPTPY
ncbi:MULTISPECIES: PQQ-dependent sugar dehydrogenase [unclassified Lysobacter]|uniref:PQQ-dependent sugar dehydrogenase n=1 Tax=unclassified Lysobacter TaxID=2635362 RepID=UPI000B0956CC|nr:MULTISPECIES: PQQ-dependent sugar dehydrogenase [unclassified Lysobacter]